jgi:hypothetical protein
MANALKLGAPFVFTYHHNDLKAYVPIAISILDSGLICTASLPCPAEMGASIHINGSGSSIIDTVFVCRLSGSIPGKQLPNSVVGVANLVDEDLDKLRIGNVKPTFGDTRCIAYGHLIRLAIWNLRSSWDKTVGVDKKISAITSWLQSFGGWPEVDKHLNHSLKKPDVKLVIEIRKNIKKNGIFHANISF